MKLKSKGILKKKSKEGNYFLFTFELDSPIPLMPGQFLMLTSDESIGLFLPRPFSPLYVDGRILELLIKPVGKMTNLLAEYETGKEMIFIGPLGKTIEVEKKGALIAGGIGIAPLFFQSFFMEGGLFFIGGKNRNEIYGVEKLKSKGFEVFVSTDDGSIGKRGFITNAFEEFLKKSPGKLRGLKVFSCGPKEMLKRMQEIGSIYDLNLFFYLEERMGCGMGGCKGCAIKTNNGYKLVCIDGPVFRADEVIID